MRSHSIDGMFINIVPGRSQLTCEDLSLKVVYLWIDLILRLNLDWKLIEVNWNVVGLTETQEGKKTLAELTYTTIA